MIRANQDIRSRIEENRIKYWEVAKMYGINDNNFSRKLRTELNAEEKEKINSIIDELVKAN